MFLKEFVQLFEYTTFWRRRVLDKNDDESQIIREFQPLGRFSLSPFAGSKGEKNT